MLCATPRRRLRRSSARGVLGQGEGVAEIDALLASAINVKSITEEVITLEAAKIRLRDERVQPIAGEINKGVEQGVSVALGYLEMRRANLKAQIEHAGWMAPAVGRPSFSFCSVRSSFRCSTSPGRSPP